MKNIKTALIILVALAFTMHSCLDDFLEIEPKTNRLEANSYSTEDDAMDAVTAVYDAMHVQNFNYVPIQSDIFSDDAFAAGEPGGGMREWHEQEESDMTTENNGSKHLWERCYSGIYRANFYFTKEEGITWSTPGLKDRLHAEALAGRAYFYWDLVRHFGWVPIIESYISDPEAYKSIPQSTPDKVYELIVRDLMLAIEYLPERSELSEAELGRMTKDYVRVLLARIYMHHEGFAKPVMGLTENLAIDKAYVLNSMETIISDGPYSLLDNYADIFSWDNENNAESIFELQYGDNAKSEDWGGWKVDGNFSSVFYGPRDPKGDTTISNGWSFATLSWDLINEFEEGDSRYDVTVYNADEKLTEYTKGYQNTGYFNFKYMALTAYDPTLNGGIKDHNWLINYKDMRYAEVLLIAAELLLEDNNAVATDYLNQVRTRALGADAAKASVTLDDIYHERRVEFAGEGHRKWDLLRRGLDYAKQEIDESWNVPDGIPNASEFTEGVFLKETWGMIPIPQSEIELMNQGMLKQAIPAFGGTPWYE